MLDDKNDVLFLIFTIVVYAVVSGVMFSLGVTHVAWHIILGLVGGFLMSQWWYGRKY